MIVFVLLTLAGFASAKVYDRCELARELKFVHKAPSHQLATWVCIAAHESQYNTSIVGHLCGDGSGDHGIFQISDLFWCSPPGKGYGCDITCAELEDDDITDDYICAQKIYKEHKQLSGDGFNAWAVYKPLCKGSKSERYIKDCFNDVEEPKSISTPATAFAHGFFDTFAGRTNNGISTSTTKPSYFSYTPSVVTKQELTFSPFKLTNRFSTDNIDLFFTPTTSSVYKPTTSTTISPPVGNFAFFKSTPTPLNVVSTPSTSISNFRNTFSTPSIFFTPTISSTTTYQVNDISQPVRKPIFIINGVQWYK